ncbi:MAG: putative deoxyribonuclease [Ilumatobacteraceae bacterium]|nr:putative deoxyribonuclease [Ilumatobacteraceae bacterium]
MNWTDNHCHLHDARIPGGPAAAVEAAHAAGVSTMITVGCDAETSRAAIAVAEQFDGVWATVGLHPHDAVNGVDTIATMFDHPKVIAVGECGLDFHYDHSPRDVQRAAFVEQIHLAHRLHLPLIIHTREAWAETFDILRAEGAPVQTIFHCFTGDADDARQCLDLGGFVSFSGIVTFKTATDVQEAARICPLDRLLVETDSPYLAPLPHRGKPNQPSLVTVVGGFIAGLRGDDVETIAASSTAAACLAFPRLAP